MTKTNENAIDNEPLGAEVPKPPLCALLDEHDIFIGMILIPETPTDRHLLDISECDLPPGRYRWISKDGHFTPAAAESMSPSSGVPTLEEAFYGLLLMLKDMPLDPRVAHWRCWFEKSLSGGVK